MVSHIDIYTHELTALFAGLFFACGLIGLFIVEIVKMLARLDKMQ